MSTDILSWVFLFWVFLFWAFGFGSFCFRFFVWPLGGFQACDVTYRADWDELVWMVHHGDEEVEQNDDVDHGEGAEHLGPIL